MTVVSIQRYGIQIDTVLGSSIQVVHIDGFLDTIARIYDRVWFDKSCSCNRCLVAIEISIHSLSTVIILSSRSTSALSVDTSHRICSSSQYSRYGSLSSPPPACRRRRHDHRFGCHPSCFQASNPSVYCEQGSQCPWRSRSH